MEFHVKFDIPPFPEDFLKECGLHECNPKDSNFQRSFQILSLFIGEVKQGIDRTNTNYIYTPKDLVRDMKRYLHAVDYDSEYHVQLLVSMILYTCEVVTHVDVEGKEVDGSQSLPAQDLEERRQAVSIEVWMR